MRYVSKAIAALFCMLLAASPAGSGSMLLLGAGTSGAAATTTTWDAANAAVKVTVTNGGLTATQTGATGGFNSVKSITSHASGKFCFQINAGTVVGTFMIGMGNATESLTNFPGNDNNGFGTTSAGLVWYNSANPTSSNPTFVAGDTVIECVDITSALTWTKVNSGSWNNNGSADPATGVGGIPLTSVALAAGPFFAMGMFSSQNDANTLTTIGSLPSGYSNW